MRRLLTLTFTLARGICNPLDAVFPLATCQANFCRTVRRTHAALHVLYTCTCCRAVCARCACVLCACHALSTCCAHAPQGAEGYFDFMLNLVAHIRYYANVLVGVVGVSVLVQGVLLVNLWNLRQRFRGRRDGYDDKGFELPRDALGAVLRRGTAAYSVEVTRRSVARGRGSSVPWGVPVEDEEGGGLQLLSYQDGGAAEQKRRACSHVEARPRRASQEARARLGPSCGDGGDGGGGGGGGGEYGGSGAVPRGASRRPSELERYERTSTALGGARSSRSPETGRPTVSGEAVQRLVEMGFERNDVVAALSKGRGDPEVALERLIAQTSRHPSMASNVSASSSISLSGVGRKQSAGYI